MAPRSLPILFAGETGSGKEVARDFFIRYLPAADEPFMAVNCAAIPAELLESEVFGHEKGAFSGAHQRTSATPNARAAACCSSTRSPRCRSRCNRSCCVCSEERAFHRVGGETNVPLKARIVCATSENLAEQVRRGTFREDLFYRINAVTVDCPRSRASGRHSLAAFPLFCADLRTGRKFRCEDEFARRGSRVV